MRALIKWAMASLVLFVGIMSILLLGIGIFASQTYPLKYKDEVTKVANEFHLEPTLVIALAYTESHLNPESTSGAGAVGITQVLPSTAASVWPNISHEPFTPKLLRDPYQGLRIGTAYLRQNIDGYMGQGYSMDDATRLALYHYNGGPGAVARYLSAKNTDALPRETQAFAPLVLKRKQKYEELYGRDLSIAPSPVGLPPGAGLADFLNPSKLLNVLL